MKVLALLSRCHTKSFGMLPFIVDAGARSLFLCLGLVPESWYRQFVSKKEFAGLSKNGDITDISLLDFSVEIDQKNADAIAAGWLGDSFFKESAEIGLPVLALPQNLNTIEGKGVFWIEDSNAIYRRMESWVQEAAKRVFKEKSWKIFWLMHWTLPDAPETLAAIWYLKGTQELKDNEIDFQLKTYFKDKKKRTLIAEHKKLIRRYLDM